MLFILFCQGCLGVPDPGKYSFFHFARGTKRKSTQLSAFFRLTSSCSHCYKHYCAASTIPSGAPLFTAPPTPFPAALRFLSRRQRHPQRRSAFHRAANTIPSGAPLSPRHQHHFQRRSTFHRTASTIPSGAPLFTAPPTPFPAALRSSPRRQHHPQRRSAFHCVANIISSGAPLSPRHYDNTQRRSSKKKATGKPVAILNKEHAQNCYFFRISIAFGVREF